MPPIPSPVKSKWLQLFCCGATASWRVTANQPTTTNQPLSDTDNNRQLRMMGWPRSGDLGTTNSAHLFHLRVNSQATIQQSDARQALSQATGVWPQNAVVQCIIVFYYAWSIIMLKLRLIMQTNICFVFMFNKFITLHSCRPSNGVYAAARAVLCDVYSLPPTRLLCVI